MNALVMDILDEWIDAVNGDGSWLDALLEPWLASPLMGPLLLATMVWVSLGLAFYIYGDGLILPLTITIIYASVVISTLPGQLTWIAVAILVIGVSVILVAMLWWMSRA